MNEELLLEGLARELVNKINTMRKEGGFEVTDRIRLTLETTPRVRECLAKFQGYVEGEVLAVEVQFGPCEGEEWDLNGEKTRIGIRGT